MIGENGFENIAWFIGLVEDNDDNNGRVRVRAYGFHPPIPDGMVETTDLPWAHVVRHSKVVTPFDKGDLVVGFFMDGRDAQHPVVIGTINSAKFSSPSARGLTSDTTTGGIATGGSGVIPTGGTVTIEEAYGLARQAGFNDSEARTMAAIAVAESGLNSAAFNGNVNTGDTSYGLWQINMIGDLGVERRAQFGLTADEQLYDPLTNARAAYEIYKQQGFAAWSVYKNGSYAQYLDQVQNIDASNINASQFENPYLAPSQDAVDNFGRPALPPQMTGEDIEQTPALVQAATRRTVQFSSGYSSAEPHGPSRGHVTNTSVWHTRYGGSNITMSGKNTSDEYIDISHASGSRVTLDGNGNITIKAMGRVYIGSEDMIEESSEGFKLAHHAAGYALEVTSGKVQIISAGDVEISSHANMTLNAGGRLILNAGDSIDMAGSRIAATARVDAIDLVAAGKMALHSQKTGLSINSTEGMFIQSGKKLSVKSGEDMIIQSSQNLGMKAEDNVGVQSVGGTLGLKSMGSATIASSVNVGFNASGLVMVKGSAIHLNSPGIDPADVPDSDDAEETLSALEANVPDPIPLKTVGESKASCSPSDISSDMVDDTE